MPLHGVVLTLKDNSGVRVPRLYPKKTSKSKIGFKKFPILTGNLSLNKKKSSPVSRK